MVITGLDLFVEHFTKHKDKFVLIGGSACHIHLEEHGLEFRRTKDLDIVLLLDIGQVDTQFTKSFWEFVKLAGYEIKQRSSGKPIFYRFNKPKNQTFPFMLELFSRKFESFKLHGDSQCTPIPAEDELSSLSAILLNDEYYTLIVSNNKTVNEIQVVTSECLIALKAKAFLDLTKRLAGGEKIDSDKIKKHKNDIFRLSQLLSDDNQCNVPSQITDDLRQFINIVKQEPPDLKNLGLKGIAIDDVLMAIGKVYGIQQEGN